MKSIVVTYPDYQSLPKAIKRMLVASESHFYEEAKSPHCGGRRIIQMRGRVLNEEADVVEHAFALRAACGWKHNHATPSRETNPPGLLHP